MGEKTITGKEVSSVSLIVKQIKSDLLARHGDVIFADRELVVEVSGSGDDATYKFKIGDGKTPYSSLKYVSSIYALFPSFKLCNGDYSKVLNITFGE